MLMRNISVKHSRKWIGRSSKNAALVEKLAAASSLKTYAQKLGQAVSPFKLWLPWQMPRLGYSQA